MMDVREAMKKVVIFSVKGCYRLICNHPFFVGMLCFLLFMYRSFPFLFSLLVSGFPVLVCTAILLGTLLSFGKPNIPEIERDERTTHEIVLLKTEFSENNVVFGGNESGNVERYGGKGEDVVEQLVKETSSVVNEICRDDPDASVGQLSEIRCREIEFDDRVQEERRREFVDLELENKNEIFEEGLYGRSIVENHYSLILEVDDEQLDLENDRSPACSVDSKVVNIDSLDSLPCSPFGHVNQEEDDDESLDSGSDRAESSSPDALMADILPVLDELHPLLDEEAPHRVNLSYDGSDASSEQSISDGSSNESDNDTEKQVSKVAENDNEDGEDEDETNDLEDKTKSAITWTEEDERNLMDLGSSERERNQRLEKLIARRRSRKTMSMVPETNLIDLESTDLTVNVPPILTTRNNPFNHSQDSYEDMGLPPIPGSAPSVLLNRRNPFDIPYDSSEEKPDLMEDSFQQEFTPSKSKGHFFRRHESFNAWRTPFGIDRPEKKDMSRFGPYFVAEQLGPEGTSYSHFQRQLSGISDSKASSVPDTGSIGSSENTEEWNVTEEGTSEIEDRNNVEDDITRELDLLTRTEQASELAGHGSESSDGESSLKLGHVEKRPMKNYETDTTLEDTGYHQNSESTIVAEKRLANQFNISLTETYSNVEGREPRYRSISSSSSLSEESERIYVEKEVEEFRSFTDGIYQLEESTISAQPSLQDSQLIVIVQLRDDAFHRDPVNDLSPSTVKETLSRSSHASDRQSVSDIDLSHVVIKKNVSFSERVTVIGSREMETDAIVNKEMLAASSEMIRAVKSQMASSSDFPINMQNDGIYETEKIYGGDLKMNDVNYEFSKDVKIYASTPTSGVPGTEIMAEQVDVKYDFSECEKTSESTTSSIVPETVLGHIEKSSSFRSVDETNVDEDVTFGHSRIFYADTDVTQSLSVPFNEQYLVGSIEELDSENVARGSHAPLNMLSSNGQSVADHVTQGESMLSEQSLFQSNFDRPDHEDMTLTSLRHQYPSAECSVYVEEMALLQNSFYKPSPEDHKEALHLQKTDFSVVESIMEASNADSWSNYIITQINNKLLLDIEVPASPESTTVPAEVFGFQSVDEVDELKEIDEQLLEELDTVGDFHVKEFRELHDPVEFGSQLYLVQHDAGSSITLIKGNLTQAHEAEQAVHAEELGSTIKEFDQYDEDMKHVSEFQLPRSSASNIHPSQYAGIGVDDCRPLQSTEEKINSKAKQPDDEINSLEEISDIEEKESMMTEIEAHFAKMIEEMIIKAELTSAKTGVMHIDLPPPLVDYVLEETSSAGSESKEADKTHGQAKGHMETQEFQYLNNLDLNQPLEDNVEKLMVSSSVVSANSTKYVEGTFPELVVSESQYLNGSDSAMKQEFQCSPSEGLGLSEDITAEDVRADLDSPRESKSGVGESDMKKNLPNSLEADIVEAKTPECDDVLISDRKSLEDCFSPLKQSGSSPSEALKMPKDIQTDIYSLGEAKSDAEEYDVKKTQESFLEEEHYSIEEKTPECHFVLISERQSLVDSDSALKQESQTSPSEASKLSKDGSAKYFQADTEYPRGVNSGLEESDVKGTRQKSLEEPNLAEVKTPECHYVSVSDVGNNIKE